MLGAIRRALARSSTAAPRSSELTNQRAELFRAIPDELHHRPRRGAAIPSAPLETRTVRRPAPPRTAFHSRKHSPATPAANRRESSSFSPPPPPPTPPSPSLPRHPP